MVCGALQKAFFTASYKSPTRILSDGNHVFIRVRSCPLRSVKHQSFTTVKREKLQFVAFTVKSVLRSHCKFTELYESDFKRLLRTENDFTVDAVRERIFANG